MTSKENRILIRARFATTEHIPAYGGFQFDVAQLEEMAEYYRNNAVPFYYNHNPAHPVDMEIIDAGVEKLANGEHAGWIEFLIERKQWGELESKFKEAGTEGGISISIREPLAELGTGDYLLSIAGDAAAWSRETLLSVAEPIDNTFKVSVSHVYQFAFDPNALAVVQALSSIPLNILSSYLFGLMDSTFKRPVFLQIKFQKPTGYLDLVIEASSKDLIKDAIRQLPAWLEGPEDSIHLKD